MLSRLKQNIRRQISTIFTTQLDSKQCRPQYSKLRSVRRATFSRKCLSNSKHVARQILKPVWRLGPQHTTAHAISVLQFLNLHFRQTGGLKELLYLIMWGMLIVKCYKTNSKFVSLCYECQILICNVNTFAASYLNTQGLKTSYLKSPASTLVDLTFQSRALRSFSLNQLRNLSL